MPSTNWRYLDDQDFFKSDPELTVSTTLPSVSPVIKVTLAGAAARAWSRVHVGGEYRPTGEWSCGHPIFSNGDTYIRVRPMKTGWRIGPSPGGAELFSGSVTWCPTSPRAAVSQRYNRRAWHYWDNNKLHECYITLTPQHEN